MTTISPHGKKVKIGRNMRVVLRFAARAPDRWHDIGRGRGARDAVKRLEKAGLVESRVVFNRFRVKRLEG